MYDLMTNASACRLKVPEVEKEPDQVPVLQKAAAEANGTLNGVPVPQPVQVDVPLQGGGDGQPDEQMEEPTLEDLFGDQPSDTGMDMDVLCNTLIMCGVKVVDANRAAIKMIKQDVVAQLAEMPSFHEVYGKGGLCRTTNYRRRDLNVIGLNAFDIRTCEPYGQP